MMLAMPCRKEDAAREWAVPAHKSISAYIGRNYIDYSNSMWLIVKKLCFGTKRIGINLP